MIVWGYLLEAPGRPPLRDQRAFMRAAGDGSLPQEARELIGHLWAEVCAREKWRDELANAYSKFVAAQKPLPPDFAKVLYAGIAEGSLYVRS